MADDDAAALLVRLEARIDRFEKAMKDASGAADKQTKKIEDRFSRLNKQLSREFEGIGRDLSREIGGFGNVLGALGPGGVAAAIGIGAAVAAIYALVQGAHELASEAGRIKDLSDTLGLTTTQVQALTDAGSKFALTDDKIAAALQRFSASMNEFREGNGALFRIIQQIDPALAEQLALARDLGKEIDILGKVYEKAGTRATALSRAAFGRTGFIFGELIKDIGRGGGIENLTAEFARSGDALDENLIKRVTILKREIDDMAGDAKKNFESIYSEKLLQSQKQSTELWLEFSRAAKNFTISDDLRKWLDSLGKKVPSFISDLSIIPELSAVAEVWQRIFTLQADVRKGAAPKPGSPDFIGPTLPTAAQTVGAGFSQADFAQRRQNIEAEIALLAQGANSLRTLITTATDPKDIKRYTAQYQEATEQISEKKKALLEFKTNIREKDIKILGDAATQTEKYQFEQSRLQVQMDKTGVSQSVVNRALEAFRFAQEQANFAVRSSLGIVSEEEIVKQRLAVLERQRALGLSLSATEAVRAEAIIRKEARDTYEQLQVRASQYPQLTRLALDYANTNKQLDQVLTNTMSNVENAFADAILGAKSFGDAVKSVVNAILADLIKLSVRQTITGPLISGLLGILGDGTGLGITGTATGVARASGGPVQQGRGYWVGEEGPEWFEPKQTGTILPNGVSPPAGSSGVSVVFHNDFRGADPGSESRIERQINDLRRSIPGMVVSTVRDARRRSVSGV